MKLLILFLFLLSLSSYAGFTPFRTKSVYEVVPKVSDNVNEFSFIFNTGTGVVSKSSGSIVSGCANVTTGNATCSFVGLTEEPSLTCNVVLDDHYVSYFGVTNTGVNLVVRNSSGVNDQDAWVHCIGKKSGADFKMPTVQPVTFPRDKLYNNTTGDVATEIDSSSNVLFSGSGLNIGYGASGANNQIINFYTNGGTTNTGYLYSASAGGLLKLATTTDADVQIATNNTTRAIFESGGGMNLYGIGGNIPHNCRVVSTNCGTTGACQATCAAGEIATGCGWSQNGTANANWYITLNSTNCQSGAASNTANHTTTATCCDY